MTIDTNTADEAPADGGTMARVVVTGRCRGLAELCDALADETQLDLPGWVKDVRAAAGMLEGDIPTVVLHGTEGDELPADEIAWLREHTDQPIMLLTDRPSTELLEAALAEGIADVLTLPQPPERVVFAVQRALAPPPPPAVAPEIDFSDSVVAAGVRPARVYVVLGPKGGSGKTTVATNLAGTLIRHHVKRTLLVDLDLQFGDAALVLGVEPERTIYDLIHSPGMLDAAKLAGYVVHHPAGFDLLPAPLRPEDAELVTDEGVARLLAVAREEYEAIVVDTSSTFTGGTLAAIDVARTLVMLVGLDVASLKDVRLALRTLDLISFPSDDVRIVINETSSGRAMKRRELMGALDAKIDLEIPFDDGVPALASRGDLAVITGRTAIAGAIRGIADELVEPRAKKRRIALLGRAS